MRGSPSQRDRDIFENLFVLELANNHWGSVERGLKHHPRARPGRALQQRPRRDQAPVPRRRRVHPPERSRATETLRYVKKTEATKLSREELRPDGAGDRPLSCIPMATPFDESSVDLCVEFDLPIIKVASSDLNDWPLLEKIASTRRARHRLLGGASEKDLDDLVRFFENRNIPLADQPLRVALPVRGRPARAQPDRLPAAPLSRSHHRVLVARVLRLALVDADLVRQGRPHLGAAHRHQDGDKEVRLAVLLAAPPGGRVVQGLPKAREMCGGAGRQSGCVPRQEIEYLDALVRGVYAERDLEPGYVFSTRHVRPRTSTSRFRFKRGSSRAVRS